MDCFAVVSVDCEHPSPESVTEAEREATRTAAVWEGYKLPGWHRAFCNKHGPG